MDEEKAATVAQESVATEEGFRGAAEAAEAAPEPAATKEGAVTDEGAEEPKVPGTWEEFEQSERHLTSLTEAKSAAVEEAKPDIHREAKSAAMREFDPHIQRQEASLRDLAQTGQKLLRSIRNIATDGGMEQRQFETAMQNIIDDNPGFLEAVNASMYSTGMDSALRKLADESGDSNLLSDVYLRLRNDPNMGDRGFAREVLDRLTEGRMRDRINEEREKALKPKDEEIAKLKAQINKFKGEGRTDGPERITGSAGGGKSDDELLLDPNTPIEKVREIRTRQRLTG